MATAAAPIRSPSKRLPFPARSIRGVWRLQYGPCWCHGLPGETGSFDFVRTSSGETSSSNLDFNILILSERVIAGARPAVMRMFEQVPDPKIVVAAGSCPATTSFWDGIPGGWALARDLIPVDVHVGECISGHPEALMAGVLEYALSQRNTVTSTRDPALKPARQTQRDAVAH